MTLWLPVCQLGLCRLQSTDAEVASRLHHQSSKVSASGSRTSSATMRTSRSPRPHLSKDPTSASSPLSPFTYRWPKDEVKEVVEKAQFLELVRHSGWLLKQHGNGPHPSWSRRWVRYLRVHTNTAAGLSKLMAACSFICWTTACVTLMSLEKSRMCDTFLWTEFLSEHCLEDMDLK